jgi:hypothetical protein
MENNMEWLRQNGHPKWNAVDLDYPLKGWDQYDCVKKMTVHSSPGSSRPKEINPVLEAIKTML